MSRKKIYEARAMPKGVVTITTAICADYDRRARAIRAGIDDESVRTTYERMNGWVDSALAEIEEPGIRAEILRDMVNRRGYEKSAAQLFICENSYYARRRMVLYLVAKSASLIV